MPTDRPVPARNYIFSLSLARSLSPLSLSLSLENFYPIFPAASGIDIERYFAFAVLLSSLFSRFFFFISKS